MHNLTLKRTLLNNTHKGTFRKLVDIAKVSTSLVAKTGSIALDVADKSLNKVSQVVADTYDEVQNPSTPINPEIIPSSQYDNLSPELKEKIDDILYDATQKISQIMENDARQYADDKSDSV